MPEAPLYTDWAIYNQILFQISANAIEYNRPDGAVQVQLFFMKERHNILEVESKHRRDSVPDDQFSQQDIGKLVTVIRDTGRGIADVSPEALFKEGKRSLSDSSPCGLTVARKFAELLGGKLIVKSRPGEFTQVTFEVQVTMYQVRNMNPHLRKSDSVHHLPLQKKKRLSQIGFAEHNNVARKDKSADDLISCISINQTPSELEDCHILTSIFNKNEEQ